MSVVKIITGTGLVCVVPMNGHVTPVQVIHTIILVRTPNQLLDPVAAANIFHQIKKGGKGGIRYGIGVCGVRSNFNGDCPVVIGAVAGTPRTILFIHGKANGT